MKTLAHIFGDIKLAHTVFALPYALISAHLAFDGNYSLFDTARSENNIELI